MAIAEAYVEEDGLRFGKKRKERGKISEFLTDYYERTRRRA